MEKIKILLARTSLFFRPVSFVSLILIQLFFSQVVVADYLVRSGMYETGSSFYDRFSITLEARDPNTASGNITEFSFDLRQSIGGVKFDTASGPVTVAGSGGADLTILSITGAVSLSDTSYPFDSDFQYELDGSQLLSLEFDSFPVGANIILGGDFDKTIPYPNYYVSQADLVGGLFAARITSDDNSEAETVAVGTFTDTESVAISMDIPSSPGIVRMISREPFRSELPTVVLTHGLQFISDSPFEDDTVPFDDTNLWIGMQETGAAKLIGDVTNNTVNIIQIYWQDAFQVDGLGPDLSEYITARKYVTNAGYKLASQLKTLLGADYSETIHFIGHSLGTAVNAYAARSLLDEMPSIPIAQFTALDRPDNIWKIPPPPFESHETLAERNGFPGNFFACTLPERVRLDNYFARNNFDGISNNWAGVGDLATGPFYNHDNLVDPHDLDDTLFGGETIDNDHSGVQQWYRWTIDPNNSVFRNNYFDQQNVYWASFCESGEYPNDYVGAEGINPSLDPCRKGWYWSINGQAHDPSAPFPTVFPPNNGGSDLSCSIDGDINSILLQDFVAVGVCELVVSPVGIRCSEGSSSFGSAHIEIPDDAEFLQFDYQFPSASDGDYSVIYLDDQPIWIVANETESDGWLKDSGPIPISGWRGRRILTLALNGVGQVNASVEISNIRVTTSSEEYINSEPVANAGIDQVLECTGSDGAFVILDGTGSTDSDGDVLSYTWTGPFGVLMGDVITVTLPLGTHTITLNVDDGNGGSDTDIVGVLVEDTVAPNFNLTVSPEILWPPNHKMVPIESITTITDSCDTNPLIILTSITLNESEETNTYDPDFDTILGDGSTLDDIFVDQEDNISLRAERSGKGEGRIYTIIYDSIDASGNVATASTTVTVPHNQ